MHGLCLSQGSLEKLNLLYSSVIQNKLVKHERAERSLSGGTVKAPMMTSSRAVWVLGSPCGVGEGRGGCDRNNKACCMSAIHRSV